MTTSRIAANVRAEIVTLADRHAASGLYTARDLGITRWMLDAAEVTRTASSVTVHFPRGEASTADALATVLLDRACQHLPYEALGEIVQDDARTFTLRQGRKPGPSEPGGSPVRT